jgi:hypothetical protein
MEFGQDDPSRADPIKTSGLGVSIPANWNPAAFCDHQSHQMTAK